MGNDPVAWLGASGSPRADRSARVTYISHTLMSV